MKKQEKKLEQKLELLSTFKSVDADEMKVSGVVGSDDSVDRHGDKINPKGWDLTNFKKNPVIMLNHDYSQFPIGKAVNVKRSKNSLVFDIQFSKTLPLAQEAFGLVKEGIMKAWSVGFLVKEWATAGSEYTIDSMELLELSLVGIPANPNALLNSLNADQRKMVKSFDLLLKTLEEDTKPKEKAEIEASKGVDSLEVEPEKVENDKKDEKDDEGEVKDSGGEVEGTGGEVKKEIEADEVDEADEDKIEDEEKPEEENSEEKILEKLLQSNELKSLVESAVEKAVIGQLGLKVKEVESDEEDASDPKLLLLTAIREEIKANNKDTGKTLQSFNKLLSTIK